MPMTICRYPLPGKLNHVAMPEGAEIVTAGYLVPRDLFYVWALVDPTKKPRARVFVILPTGATIDGDVKYIQSSFLPDGNHVLHVFEVLTGIGTEVTDAQEPVLPG